VGRVTDAAPGDIGALVEALDRRARQSGTEGATNVLRGMVATITEVLGGLEDRLERIEGTVAEAGATEAAEVRGSLAGLHDRMGRLEDAFVQAVESSTEGSDSIVSEIRAALAETPSVPPVAPEVAPELVRRLDDLVAKVVAFDGRLGSIEPAATAPPDGQVLTGLANLADVVRGLEARLERMERAGNDDAATRAVQEHLTGIQAELARMSARVVENQRDDRVLGAVGELRAAWEAGHDRLDRGVGAVRNALEAGSGRTEGATTSAELRDLQAAIERIGRDDNAGRLVGLIEARLGAGLEAMVSRSDAAIDASRDVRDAVQAATGRVAEMADAVDALAAAVESLGARVERETAVAIEGIGGKIVDRLATIADQQSRDATSTNDTLVDALRRESELLTQRIAALTQATEAMGATLDEHVQRTENTFSRRAGDVGRRLAEDFGLRSRKDDPEAARELGRGE
jgi:hypothetical protein